MNNANGSTQDILKVCATYSLSVLVFNVVPIIIGVLMVSMAMTETQAGLIGTADMTLMAVTGFSLAHILTNMPRRSLLLLGTGLLIVGNILSLATSGYWPLAMTRAVAGFGAGLLFVYANTRIAKSKDPVRIYGLAVTSATLLGATMLFLLPAIAANYGHEGVFIALFVLAIVFLPLAFRETSKKLGEEEHYASDGFRLSSSHLLLIVCATVLIALVQSIYYSFVERAAVAAGLSSEEVGGILAMGYVGSIFTSALAAWVSTRWGRWFPLALGIGLQSVCSIIVMTSNNPSIIPIFIMGQSLCFFFGLPYLLALKAEADSSGKFASIGAGIFFFSLAIGSLFGGIIIENFGYQTAAIINGAGTALGLLLLIPVTRALASKSMS